MDFSKTNQIFQREFINIEIGIVHSFEKSKYRNNEIGQWSWNGNYG